MFLHWKKKKWILPPSTTPSEWFSVSAWGPIKMVEKSKKWIFSYGIFFFFSRKIIFLKNIWKLYAVIVIGSERFYHFKKPIYCKSGNLAKIWKNDFLHDLKIVFWPRKIILTNLVKYKKVSKLYVETPGGIFLGHWLDTTLRKSRFQKPKLQMILYRVLFQILFILKVCEKHKLQKTSSSTLVTCPMPTKLVAQR